MNEFSLYKRMREHGTLAEKPTDVPDARFALPSTINCMRALAILVSERRMGVRERSVACRDHGRRCAVDTIVPGHDPDSRDVGLVPSASVAKRGQHFWTI
jgi:hypothetical protein